MIAAKAVTVNRSEQTEVDQFNELVDKYRKLIFFEEYSAEEKYKLGDQILKFRDLIKDNKTIEMRIMDGG